jgi:hypothetical protein
MSCEQGCTKKAARYMLSRMLTNFHFLQTLGDLSNAAIAIGAICSRSSRHKWRAIELKGRR